MTLIFFTTFAAVFIAEIVGDKLLYTTSVLAARYRTAPIMIGMAVAFMAKMGVAVLVGEAISRLPRILVATITAIRRWIQNRVSPKFVRYAAVILLIVLGCLSVGEILVERV